MTTRALIARKGLRPKGHLRRTATRHDCAVCLYSALIGGQDILRKRCSHSPYLERLAKSTPTF
jgi:hypothetical protein